MLSFIRRGRCRWRDSGEEAGEALDSEADNGHDDEELRADEEIGLVHTAIIAMGADSSSAIDEKYRSTMAQ